jgi:tripartite-type tricarboxylate transporter receptor subunit TctC
MKAVILGLAAGLALAGPASLSAQDFPSKPISMVMPYAAGGPGDTLTRILAQSMSGHLKQQVIVENIAGAGGTIGSARVSSAPPDGHSLLLIHVSQATNPFLYPNLKYDVMKDFEPVGLVADLPSVFVARKDLAPKSFAELIAYVKQNAEKATYAHAGVGSASHLCGLLFAEAAGVKLTQVAYRGSGPAMNDLIGGQVDFICDQIVNVVPNVEGGTIKAYAVTSKEPAKALPNLPTADKAGLPGFDLTIWYGLFAPKGTPKPVVDKLVAALDVALKDRAVRDNFAKLGAEAVSAERATPEALRKHLQAELDKWGAVIKKAGVTGQ